MGWSLSMAPDTNEEKSWSSSSASLPNESLTLMEHSDRSNSSVALPLGSLV